MGHLYEHGYSVDKNMAAAFNAYKKASELGCVKSTTKLGHQYYSGVRLHDYDEFMSNDELLAMTANLSTEEELPGADNSSYYVMPNREMALKMYLRAGKKGDSEACNCAALIVERENPVQGVDLYKRALELDERNTDAMFNLALLYYNKREE